MKNDFSFSDDSAKNETAQPDSASGVSILHEDHKPLHHLPRGKAWNPPILKKMVVLARQRWGTYSFKSCSHIVESALWPVTEGMRAPIFYPAFETSQPRQGHSAYSFC